MWNKIVQWTSDFKSRQIVIQDFNKKAKDKFVKKESGVLVEANTTIGCSAFKNSYSKFMASGFNIKVFSSVPFKPDQVKNIGIELLKDEAFIRNLISLGWDTLEVQDSDKLHCYKWELKKHINAVL